MYVMWKTNIFKVMVTPMTVSHTVPLYFSFPRCSPCPCIFYNNKHLQDYFLSTWDQKRLFEVIIDDELCWNVKGIVSGLRLDKVSNKAFSCSSLVVFRIDLACFLLPHKGKQQSMWEEGKWKAGERKDFWVLPFCMCFLLMPKGW